MNARPLEPLTAAEWKVMKVVWQRGDCAARDVYQVCGDKHKIAPSTVKTHLRRLVDKGYLTTTQVGNSFLYRATRPPLGSLLAAADRLLENAVAGTTAPLLAHMLKNSCITDDEIAELRTLLDQHGDQARANAKKGKR